MDFLRKIFEGKEKERKNSLFIIFLVGILLITFIPKASQKKVVLTEENKEITETSNNLDYESRLESRLESILSNVNGAGDVDVMVKISKSSEIIVSEDLEESKNTLNETDGSNGTRVTEQSSTKKSAKILGQNDEPLVLAELVPKVSGVIIVSQGANDIMVKDTLVRSVSTLLEIPTYKVEVLQKK